MKNSKSFVWLFFVPVLLFMFSNCDENEIIFTPKFEAKIDGDLKKFTPTSVIKTFQDTINGNSYNVVSIIGAPTSGSSLPILTLYLLAEKGTFDFDTYVNMGLSGKFAIGVYNNGSTLQTTYRSDNGGKVTGQVTITEMDYKVGGKVEGTFNFTGKQINGTETVSITSGVFKTKILM